MKKHITASDLYNFKKCQYRPFMDFNGEQAEAIVIHPLVKLLWDAGVQYENKVIEALKQDLQGKTFYTIDPESPLSEELATKTLEAMTTGFDYIYQGVLIAGNKAGRPDLLVKSPGKSIFGDYLYYPMDVKMARVEDAWDNGDEKLTQPQWWQLYFYGELLEKVQGVKPAFGYIYKTKSRKLRSDLSKIPAKYDRAMELLGSFLKGDPQDSEPAINSECKNCEWLKHCVPWAEERQDLSLLFWSGHAMKAGLKKLGINKISDLLDKDATVLLSQVQQLKQEGYFWKTMPNDLIGKIIRRATVHKNQKPIIYEPIEFPESNKEIHYDIEDDPTQDFVYLQGLVLFEKGKEPVYHAFFADKFDDEQKIAKELFDFFKVHDGIPVYHYSSHEKTTLLRLTKKYSSLDAIVYERLFGAGGLAIDLYQIIQDKTDWPLTSYGIKSIGTYLGFKWVAHDAGGAASIVWMNDYLKGDQQMKKKILKYNEDDCLATLFLKNKLIALQADMETLAPGCES